MMTLPDVSKKKVDQLAIQVSATPRNRNPAGYSFEDTLFIAVLDKWYSTDISFIQTDKPIYKPGQLGE